MYNEMREKLLGRSITVYQRDDEKGPEEFLVESLDLDEIIQGIASLLDAPIKFLKNKANGAMVRETKDLLFVSDVLAGIENEDNEERAVASQSRTVGESGNTPYRSGVLLILLKPLVCQKCVARDRKEEHTVLVQHMATFWCNPPEMLRFTQVEPYEALLHRTGDLLQKPIECLYTADKFSRIRSTAVLATKQRVVAASAQDKVNEEIKRLGREPASVPR